MAEKHIISETRSVGSFTAVKLRGVGHVFLSQGKDLSLEVKAPAALLRKIKTDVKDGMLEIGYKFTFLGWLQSVGDWEGVEFHICMPSLEKIVSLGVGEITAAEPLQGKTLKIVSSGAGKTTLNLEYTDIAAEVNGAGQIELIGKTENLRADINGTGRLEAFKLDSKTAVIKSRGSGKCFIMVSDTLDVQISGVGQVKYKGKPQVTSSITGFGKLEAGR